MSRAERLPGTEELQTLAEILSETFIVRWDLYAKQLEDGSYVSIKKPLRPSHLKAHLRGKMTVGAYLLNQDSKGKFLVLDADSEPDWRRLQALSGTLAEMGETSYLERSRRGGHLWMFLEEPVPAQDIRLFGQGLLDYFRIESVEMFPKQAQLTTGPGSLIRLPFGVHRKAGRRYGFYLPDWQPLAPTLTEQIYVIREHERLSKPFFDRFWDYVPDSITKRLPAASEMSQKPILHAEDDNPVPERIKNGITVRRFVLRYVELSPKGMGLCPFHDDHHPSFSVNDERNYWRCFACGTGGSIIDFWMLWRRCGFSTAVAELSNMILGPERPN